MSAYSETTMRILFEGRLQENRTGTDTISIFGAELRYDLAKEFPAITEKRAFVRGGVAELNWMLSGSTSVLDLHKRNVHFWDSWAIKGPHKVLKHINELMQEYYTKSSHMDWDLECARMVGDDKVGKLCELWNIELYKDVDDRVIYKPATIGTVCQCLVDEYGLTTEAAQELMRGLVIEEAAHVESNCDESIVNAIIVGLWKVGYDIRTVCTHTSVVAYLMDVCNFTRDVAIDLIGTDTPKEVALRLNMPPLIPVRTCEIGDLGPVYGHNWRHWPDGKGGEIDQISDLVKQLRNNPTSRRHVLHFWNPTLLPDERYTPQENVARGKMALAPCHWMCEFKVDLFTESELQDTLNKDDHDFMYDDDGKLLDLTFEQLQIHCREHHIPVGKLNIHPHMRSWDFAAGAPVNLVFYAAFCHMMAEQTGLTPGDFWMTGTDVHLYVNQIDIMSEMVQRTSRPLPQFKLKHNPWCPTFTIFDYKDDCYDLIDYNPHDTMRVPVAI